MNAGENRFRTAAFGGFQKQDVLKYIETSAREHCAKVESMEKELQALRQGREELETRCAGLEARCTALTGENERLEREMTACTQSLESARAEAVQKGQRLADAEGVCAALTEKLRTAEPAAAAYEALKDRTAGVELEAHQRARQIEDEARERARKAAQQMEQWFQRVQGGYGHLRTDLDAALSHAAGELTRVSQSLGSLTAQLDEYDADLEALARDYRADPAPQPPQPLPLDGE